MWITILCLIIAFALILTITYFGSRLQMKGWLKELEIHFGEKLTNYKQTKKEKDEEKR